MAMATVYIDGKRLLEGFDEASASMEARRLNAETPEAQIHVMDGKKTKEIWIGPLHPSRL